MGVVFFDNDAAFKWLNHLSLFEITEPLGVTWADKKGNILAKFTVLPGFRTDGPSIPKRLRGVIPFEGHHLRPSFAHDWLYEYDEDLSRLEADTLFLDAMKGDGVAWHRRHLIYRAVRAFGAGRWGPPGQKKDWNDEEVIADS